MFTDPCRRCGHRALVRQTPMAVIYVVLHDNKALYVGETGQPLWLRLRQHTAHSEWAKGFFSHELRIVPLQTCSVASHRQLDIEGKWMRRLIDRGCSLANKAIPEQRTKANA